MKEKIFSSPEMNLRGHSKKYNLTIWWSSYGSIQLKYGDFGMESHLALILTNYGQRRCFFVL